MVDSSSISTTSKSASRIPSTRQFDIGLVLEALKERGEVVSKMAYGDWQRAGDYSRSLTQHAIQDGAAQPDARR